MGIIPQTDRRLRSSMLIGQGAQTRRAQQKILCSRRLKIKPARGQASQEVPAREEQHQAVDRPDSAHDAVGSSANAIQ
jgi:hypothetical protein